MITQFGDSGDVLFRMVMVGCTGAGVCVIVLGMAAYMLIHATKQLRGLQSNEKKPPP